VNNSDGQINQHETPL